MAKPKTHEVRVLCREVPYLKWEKNAADQDVLVERTGFGPGHFRTEPVARLGPDVDVASDEYAAAQEEYQYGQVINLLDDDYNRLINTQAIADVGEEPPLVGPEGDEEYVDPSVATVEELRAWIEHDRPTVNDVVGASNGDPDTARKLLEAESKAQDGEPRKGVFDGLSTVIARG